MQSVKPLLSYRFYVCHQLIAREILQFSLPYFYDDDLEAKGMLCILDSCRRPRTPEWMTMPQMNNLDIPRLPDLEITVWCNITRVTNKRNMEFDAFLLDSSTNITAILFRDLMAVVLDLQKHSGAPRFWLLPSAVSDY